MDKGYFLTTRNATSICLIPKCVNPHYMEDFIPILLCNVVYKMISKLFSNRLKKVLSKCVSEEQSMFMEGISILDNVMLAIKIIRALKGKTKGNKSQLVLKIDISKVYDRVD